MVERSLSMREVGGSMPPFSTLAFAPPSLLHGQSCIRFARPSNVRARSLLDIPVSAACMRSLLRFRMGCHHLPRDEGSWARPHVPRLERTCRLCATNTLGDEKHLVFECPELECFRQQWSHLFQGPRTMQAFMWQDDKIGIARFISACLRKTREGQTSDQPGVAGRDVI